MNIFLDTLELNEQLRFNIAMLYSEIGMICAVILFYLMVKIRSSVIIIPNKPYIYSMISSLYIMIITDNLWKWIEPGLVKTTLQLSYFINSMYFIALDIFIYFVILYFRESKLIKYDKKLNINTYVLKFETKIMISLLFILHIVMNLSASSNHLLFYIDTNGTYKHGDYYIFEYVVPYGMLLICVIELIIKRYKDARMSHKLSIYEKPNYIVIYQLIPVIMGVIGFKFINLPLFTVGMTLFLVTFYVRVVEHFVSIDPITRLHTKQSIMKIFDNRRKDHQISFDPLTTCMFNINNYYDLNKPDGKPISDDIIYIISNVFNDINDNFTKYRPEVSRIDGLKFLIIISTDDKVILKKYKDMLLTRFQNIKKDLGEVEINITYAYIRYNDKMIPDNLINLLNNRLKDYKKSNINTYVI